MNIRTASSADTTAPYRELVRVNRSGQITIPLPIRNHLSIREGDYLEATITEGGLLLQPVRIVRRRPSNRQPRGGKKKTTDKKRK